MGERYKRRTILEIMNQTLKELRDFYDAEYAYYVERSDAEILTIYEWCADGVPWMREQLRMLPVENAPDWMKREMQEETDSQYSVFQPIDEGNTAVLAVAGVHRGGCGMQFLRALLPYLAESVALKRLQSRQEYLSYHDELTGLLNRNSYVEYITEIQTENLNSLGTLAVDINGLKQFNIEFGNEYGDEVVIRVGELLEEYFRSAKVFRMTGDEFLVVCEDISFDDFTHQRHAIHQKLDNISLDLVCIGYAWEKVEINADHLVIQAHEMLNQEKQAYYKRRKKGDHKPLIKQDLLNDIKEGRYIVCMQPEFDIQNDVLSGAEAHTRYQHKELGIMEPARYLAKLEQTKLIYYLDIYVFEEVCKFLHKWMLDGLTIVPVTVKISGVTLRREGIVEELLNLMNRYQIPAEYLVVEVAESDSDMNQEMIAESGSRIRQENIQVTLDKFASRGSSLTILSLMEVDRLKLDRSLTLDLVGNRKSQILAKAIIDICSQMGIQVIANGIETQDQLNVWRELGCEYAQGYIFNKPITADTFEKRYLV